MKNYLKAFILMLVGIFSISLTACNKLTNKNTKTYNVLTDSMKWDDEYAPLPEWDNYEIKGFGNGDKIVVSFEYDELKVGDVITYTFFDDQIGKTTDSHRIVDIFTDSSIYVVQADRISQQYPYRSEDKSDLYDLESSGRIRYINSNDIIGKVIKVKYKES